MKGWILYSKSEEELEPSDNGVNRLLGAAKQKGIDLRVLKPEHFDLVVSRDDKKSIIVKGAYQALPDFIIPRLGSNTTYFALAVLRQLERLGVYVCNNASSIETVKDKLHIHQILAHSNLPTPKTMLVKFPIDIEVVRKEIGYPLLLKNITGTEGKGIHLIEREDQFLDIMDFLEGAGGATNIILQEFIKTSYGKDLRVFVLGGRVIGCMQRISKEGFKANFSRGGDVAPYELTPLIEWLATETARLVGLDIAGIDLLFDGDEFRICEANSSPGFLGLEKVIGFTVAEQILDYITLRVTGSISSEG